MFFKTMIWFLLSFYGNKHEEELFSILQDFTLIVDCLTPSSALVNLRYFGLHNYSLSNHHIISIIDCCQSD